MIGLRVVQGVCHTRYGYRFATGSLAHHAPVSSRHEPPPIGRVRLDADSFETEVTVESSSVGENEGIVGRLTGAWGW